MGIVFRTLGFVSLGLLVCAGCGDASTEGETNGGPPPFMGNIGTPPQQPAMPAPSANPDPGGPMNPATSPPTSSETSSTNVPVVPSTPPTDGTTPAPQDPPEPTPSEMTPPQEPPTEGPPPEEPPPEEPPPAGPQTRVFLLFGQSNMWGVPLPQQQDLAVNPRVEVLTLQACSQHGNNQWVPAQPPLHGCVGAPGTNGQGPGVGPGDYFAKAIADAFPQDTILLVPAAVPGVSINTFQPGQQNYNNLLNRARMAQERGEIAGMIFHQGETDTGQGDWPTRVKNSVDRLRADLGIGEVPFVAGELLYNPAGCCGNGHNPLINQLPTVISNAAVVRAEGFTALPASVDGAGNLHFDLASQREFGRRYAQAMLQLLGD
jgi:hypothetical protein